MDLSYQIDDNAQNPHNNIKDYDDSKNDDDSILQFNEICSNYEEEDEQEEKVHTNKEYNRDNYSLSKKYCGNNNKNNRKISIFPKKCKENPEHYERKKYKLNNNIEYKELIFNQHKENIHKLKEEFNHANERKKKNNFKNKYNINSENEEEQNVKIVINNMQYKYLLTKLIY